MYAVIEDSGRQYRVAVGDVINVDVRPLAAGAEEVEFGRVLLVGGAEAGPVIGTPIVAGAKVKAKLTATAQPAARHPDDPEATKGVFNVKGPKLDIWHFRRRKSRSRKKTGHRQKYLQVKVTEILGG